MRVLSQHLYLPEKVVTNNFWVEFRRLEKSQHLYLPEKVVTTRSNKKYSWLLKSQHLYLPEKVVTPTILTQDRERVPAPHFDGLAKNRPPAPKQSLQNG